MTQRAVIVSPFAPPHRGGVEGFVGWLEEALAAEGYEPRIITSHGEGAVRWPVARVQPANIPLPLPSLRFNRLVREEIAKADVVLIQNFFWPLSWIAAEAVRRSRTRALTIVHGNALVPHGASLLLRGIASAQARTIARRQFEVAPPVAISQSSAEFLREIFDVEPPVLPLPLSIPDRDDVARRQVSPGDGGPLKLLFAGRLVKLKDPGTAVAAAVELAAARDVHLDVYGDGPERKNLQRSSPSWVAFHGAQDRGVVLAAMRKSHVVLNSSLTDNALTTVLEALCLGTPVISTDVGEARTYLRGELIDAVVPVGQPDALAAATRRLAVDFDSWLARVCTRGAELRLEHDPLLVREALVDLIR